MKLGIMQPYFFPYLAYFDLMNSVDEWIVFDTVQYIRHGWGNRNRILHPSSGWQYVSLPVVKHSQTAPINIIEISPQGDWQEKIIRQLEHYKKFSPFYDDVVFFLNECFAGLGSNLAAVNTQLLRDVCHRLGIQKKFSVFSEMGLGIRNVDHPGDWAFEISKALNASEYINLSGGEHLFDKFKFEESGIKLTIQTFKDMEYATGKYDFIPGLSIIDVMMWNSPKEIKAYLDTYRNL